MRRIRKRTTNIKSTDMSFNYKTRKNELKKIIASNCTRICFSAWVRKKFNKTVKCVLMVSLVIFSLGFSPRNSHFIFRFFRSLAVVEINSLLCEYVMRKLFGFAPRSFVQFTEPMFTVEKLRIWFIAFH